jgi:hypothetical protein
MLLTLFTLFYVVQRRFLLWGMGLLPSFSHQTQRERTHSETPQNMNGITIFRSALKESPFTWIVVCLRLLACLFACLLLLLSFG